MTHPNTPSSDADRAAQFAWQVVERLQRAGFEALWAGGCVRDRLMGKTPKDYDVATRATPEQVRSLFGPRRTLAIGAAFGVVAVVGPRGAGTIEVATFRREEGYSDGRHPDRVAYSTAREDALRRDFTINGIFYDPLADRVLDFVDGQQDIRRELIRAIGDPQQRFDEDRLRMLRAVRFATVLGFEIDRATLAAIIEHAGRIVAVSAERIAAEMRHILLDRRHTIGLELLRVTGLWRVILPEYQRADGDLQAGPDGDRWRQLLACFGQLAPPLPMSVACAAILWPIVAAQPAAPHVAALADRWRLTHHEQRDVQWLLMHLPVVEQARQRTWPQLQRVLADSRAEPLVTLLRATTIARHGVDAPLGDWQHCRQRLSLPQEVLNPAPLIDGHQLQKLGIPPGPALGKLLEKVRDAQLEGRLTSTDEALQWAARHREAAEDD
jgi:tRNA nucleotidyltransferase/poly(A) polymerase